jgi:hypothetical protein
VPVPFYCRGAQAMNRNLINRCSPTRLLSPLPLIVLTGLGLSVANAQTSPQSQIVRPATTSSTTTTSGSGQYYFEFRSRQAWDYGHTFVVFDPRRRGTQQEELLLAFRQRAMTRRCG